MPHSTLLGPVSGSTRLGMRQLRSMCAPAPQQHRLQPHACYVAICSPSIRARARAGVTSAYNGNTSPVPGAGSDSFSQRDSSTANNGTHPAEQPGWSSGDYSGSGSAWSDTSWPTSADWGETANPGDWGEVPSVGQAASPHYSTGYAQRNQQYPANPAGDPAAGNTSSESSSYSNGASGPYNQAGSTGTAAGTFYGTDYTTSGSSDGFNSHASKYSSSASQQPDGASSWPFADASAAQQQQQQSSFQGSVNMPPLLPSDITLIGRRDADSMLPLAPSVEQARYYQPRSLSERLVQIMGSFGVSVVLSKSAVLAGPALLYPIWGPWIRAGMRNVQMYLRQFKSVGLWRAEVTSVQLNTVPYAYRQAVPVSDSIIITVGDPWQGGARTELTFPYQAGCEDIVEGEPAELLVLCQDDAFMNFKVVRELYLPQSGMWLWEYPFVDRDVFLDVSLAIERGRQAATGSNTSAATAAGAAGSYQTYGGYQQPYAGFAPAAAAAAAGVGAAGGLYGSMGSDAAATGPGGFADWVVPDSGSSSSTACTAGGTVGGIAGSSSSSSNGYQGYSSGSGAMYDNGSTAGPPPTSSSSSTYGYGNNSSSKYSSTAAADSTDAAAAAAAAAGGMIDDFAGVASQVSAVASQVTGVATHAAADVASGVAAGVAAGLGWINSAAPASSSTNTSGSSSSDNAVVPDVIIDSQGVWSPMGGYVSSSSYMYGPSSPSSYGHRPGSSYSSSNGWPGQQMGGYGQPYMDSGFAGAYQHDAAGFGTGGYAGGWYGPPGRAPGGYVGYQTGDGFNAAAGAAAMSGWSSPGVNYSSRYGDSSGFGGYEGYSAGEAADQQTSGTAQDTAGWQERSTGQASGPGTSNSAEASARTQ